MRVHLAHYGFLTLASAVIVGCSADQPTAPSARARALSGHFADLTDLTTTPALYDQFTGFDINYDPGSFGNTVYLADDFDVPANGVWHVSQVGVTAYLFRPLSFSIRADAGGHPGALVPNTDVTLSASKFGGFGLVGVSNFLFNLPSTIKLPAGKYWLTLLVSAPDIPQQIAWEEHAQVNSPGARSVDGTTWQSAGTDYTFAIFGKASSTPTITFETIKPNPAAVGSTATLVASASDGLNVTFSAAPSNVCKLNGTTVSFVGVGFCAVSATTVADDSHEPAGETQNILVVQAVQTITFTSAMPAPAYVMGTYTVAATGGASGKPVVITVASPNVCTVAGNIVTFVGVGTCIVTANQAGSDAYSAAAPVTQTVKVDYRYDGFLGSVKNGDVMNSAKAGQSIPLQWRLTDATGAPITTLTSVKLTVTDLNCALGVTGDQVAEQAAGNSGLQNLGDGYYQYNWKSPASYAKSCKTLQLDLGEGTGARTARYVFK
jgi:hypothetical protein